jgi:hypothetical protein
MSLALVNQTIIGLNEQAIEEWIEYREEKKKPLSPLALKKSKNLLMKYGLAEQQHFVDIAISNDWVGIHPCPMPKVMPQQSTRDTSFQQDLTDTSWA